MIVHAHSNVIFENDKCVVVSLSKNKTIRNSELKFYLDLYKTKFLKTIDGLYGHILLYRNGNKNPVIFVTDKTMDEIYDSILENTVEFSPYHYSNNSNTVYFGFKYVYDEIKTKNDYEGGLTFISNFMDFSEILKIGVFKKLKNLQFLDQKRLNSLEISETNFPSLEKLCISRPDISLLGNVTHPNIDLFIYDGDYDSLRQVKRLKSERKLKPKNIFIKKKPYTGWGRSSLYDYVNFEGPECDYLFNDSSKIYPTEKKVSLYKFIYPIKPKKIIFDKPISLDLYDITILRDINCVFLSEVNFKFDNFCYETLQFFNDFMKKNSIKNYRTTEQSYSINVISRTQNYMMKIKHGNNINYITNVVIDHDFIMKYPCVIGENVTIRIKEPLSVNELTDYINKYQMVFLYDMSFTKSQSFPVSKFISKCTDKKLLNKIKINDTEK